MFDKALFALPGIKRILGILGLLAIVQAACIVGQAFTLAWALSNLWHGATLDAQAAYIGGFFGCFFARQACATAQDAALARYAHEQTSDLRKRLLDTALGTPAVRKKVLLLTP